MPQQVALLDNTIQVDRNKSGSRRSHIEEVLKAYGLTVSTSICLLEFKATLIQECITIHDKLRSVGLYTRVVDYLTESRHPQAKLRGHILRNLVNVCAPSSFNVTEERDRRLAEKARLLLEHTIPRLYNWFSRGVDAVLHDEINCTRAMEPPQKKRVAFGVNLPECRAENKHCSVETFIRARAPSLLDGLDSALEGAQGEELAQLRRARDLFRLVLERPELRLSHSDCRSAGDCLIAMEGSQHATHALSTNASDWEVICRILGCRFVRVEYPPLRPGGA
jgi:hypothetical protein